MTERTQLPFPSFSIERLPLTLLTTLGVLIWSHALFGVLRGVFSVPFEVLAPASASLSWAALGTGLLASFETADARRGVAFGALGGGLFAVVLTLLHPKALFPSLALPLVGGAFGGLRVWLEARVARGLWDEFRKSRGFRLLWLALSVVALVQVARLTTYMSNPDSNWFLSTGHPFFAKHECSNAYFYGAELGLRGESDLYDPAHYPGLNPEAKPSTHLVGMHPEDPYQYPPTFLLLPRLFMAFSNDYAAIRSVWFALNVTLCMSSVMALGAWLGRRKSWKFLLLSPAVLVAFPVLYNFQYGQFHFAAVALSVLALLAFERRWPLVGGTLLAVAIWSKLFPALVLFVLAGQRKWHAVFWSAAALAGFGLLGYVVIGPQAHEAFLFRHVPRLMDGSAFAFGQAWPEVFDLVVAGNQGIAGLFHKLGLLGLELPASLPKYVSAVYLMALPIFAYSMGATESSDAPLSRAVKWLGVLGLGSLASAGAWADYVPLTAVWIVVYLLASEPSKMARSALWVVAVFQFTLLGSLPVGSLSSAWWMTPLSLVGALLLLGLFVRAVTTGTRPRLLGSPSSVGGLPGPVHSMRHE